MQKYTKQVNFENMDDKANTADGTVSTAFNESMIGRPITGRTEAQVKANNDKYSIFGSEGVGEHFGRSGSPKGSSPKI